MPTEQHEDRAAMLLMMYEHAVRAHERLCAVRRENGAEPSKEQESARRHVVALYEEVRAAMVK